MKFLGAHWCCIHRCLSPHADAEVALVTFERGSCVFDSGVDAPCVWAECADPLSAACQLAVAEYCAGGADDSACAMLLLHFEREQGAETLSFHYPKLPARHDMWLLPSAPKAHPAESSAVKSSRSSS